VIHRASPTISCRQIEKELILLDSSNGKVFHLNTTASLIFCLCDGTNGEEAILRELQRTFQNEDAGNLRHDLFRTLKYLKQENVIATCDAT
jgi:hypothetical protein